MPTPPMMETIRTTDSHGLIIEMGDFSVDSSTSDSFIIYNNKYQCQTFGSRNNRLYICYTATLLFLESTHARRTEEICGLIKSKQTRR